ncbi:hypothetical protein PSPO01_16408 [Paraphaeosphaeria sporulosa]
MILSNTFWTTSILPRKNVTISSTLQSLVTEQKV